MNIQHSNDVDSNCIQIHSINCNEIEINLGQFSVEQQQLTILSLATKRKRVLRTPKPCGDRRPNVLSDIDAKNVTTY